MSHLPRPTLAVLLSSCALACSEDPIDLTAPVAAGEARAGVVSKAADLIGGPTADGRIGDFKLVNSKIAVIVQQAGPSNGYGIYGGGIVEADVVRAPGVAGRSRMGEIINLFNRRTPNATSGEVINDGRDGKDAIVRLKGSDDAFPLVEAVLGQSRGAMNLKIETDYVLEPGADFVRIITRLENTSGAELSLQDHLIGFVFGDGLQQFLPGQGFNLSQTPAPAPWFGATCDDVSYSFLSLSGSFTPLLTFQGFLMASLPGALVAAGASTEFEDVLVVGRGDLAAHDRTHAKLFGELGDVDEKVAVSGVVTAGGPVAGARIHAVDDKGRYTLQAISGADGTFTMSLNAGKYSLRATADGRDAGAGVEVTAPATGVALKVGELGAITIDAKELGRPVPIRVMARRVNAPPQVPRNFGVDERPSGWERIEFLPPAATTLAVPPGSWELLFARGFEYEIEHATVEVKAGETAKVSPVMRHVVDTAGWLSGDYHVHAQLSADSDDLFEHKVAAFAADHVEVPVCTEHEHIGDFGPTIGKLGLGAWVASIIGEEVSTTSLGHFNAFPLLRDPAQQNFGAILWYGVKGDDLMKKMRANPGRPLVQVNHPRSGSFGSPFIKGYFSAVGFDAANFTVRAPHDWSRDFDAVEIANGGTPGYEDWFTFLDRGVRMLATGDSDSHVARTDPLGYPRNYVHVADDTTAKFDVGAYMTELRSGKLSVSGGYFVEARVGEDLPGALLAAGRVVDSKLTMHVRVQAPVWIGEGTLEVLVNGEVAATKPLPATPVTRIDADLPVSLPSARDAWIVARVRGPSMPAPYDGKDAFGFANAIYVDGDGNGRFDALKPVP